METGDGRVLTVHEAADASSSLMPWEDFLKQCIFLREAVGENFHPTFNNGMRFLLYGRHLVTDISEVLSNAKIYGFEFFYYE